MLGGKWSIKMDIMINSSYFSKFLQKEKTIKLK